jgi:hypothetical protein
MDMPESVPDTNVIDRKELLAQQFDELEAEPKAERVRSADGKYAPNTPVEAPEVVEEPPVWQRAPASWKKDYHEEWAAASPKLQEYAWQREEQMRAGVEPLISKAQYADEMERVVQPYLNTINGLGIKPSEAISGLLQADNILRNGSPQEKEYYFAQLREQYGMGAANQDGMQQAPQHDIVYGLRNELNSVRGEMQQWKQEKEAESSKIMNSEIEAFAQQHENFEELRPDMIQLLQGGMANNLVEAHQKALRLNPELYDRQLQAQQASANVQKIGQVDKAAKAARAAAVSVKSSTPGVSTTTKAQDRRSMLVEQFANLDERF